MRTCIFIFFTVLLLAGSSACYYSDTDMYYVEPTAGDPPLVSVSTSLDSLDEPTISDSLEVVYQVEVSGGEFYYVYAELARSVIFESDSSQGSFWITPYMADSSGTDTLYMEYYYSTNTNSLADKLGYEASVRYQNFALEFMLGGTK